MRNRDQLRAQAAFPLVESVQREGAQEQRKKYSTRARQMPSLIHRSGLCQAVAFYQSKSLGVKPEHRAFQDYLAHLAKVVLLDEPESDRTTVRLASLSRTLDFASYQWLSRNALQSALWLKRYAEALLEREEEASARTEG